MTEAPRVVLLPGLDGTGILFRPLLQALPKDVPSTFIAYPSDRIMSLSEHAEWVSARLPKGKFALLAESFSGLVALSLLLETPSRFQSVIFVGSFAEPPRPFMLRLAPILPRHGSLMRTIPSFLLRQYCLGKEATVTQLNMLRDAIGAVSPEVFAHRLGIVAKRHHFGTGQFHVPCCYIQASKDRLVPERCGQWFRQRFDSFELTRVEGPHFLLQARPEESARIVAETLRNLR
jgi:pimeloyl-ACP methyl ester carboxylesterase